MYVVGQKQRLFLFRCGVSIHDVAFGLEGLVLEDVSRHGGVGFQQAFLACILLFGLPWILWLLLLILVLLLLAGCNPRLLLCPKLLLLCDRLLLVLLGLIEIVHLLQQPLRLGKLPVLLVLRVEATGPNALVEELTAEGERGDAILVGDAAGYRRLAAPLHAQDPQPRGWDGWGDGWSVLLGFLLEHSQLLLRFEVVGLTLVHEHLLLVALLQHPLGEGHWAVLLAPA
mmetsp:Transcript_56529/g.100725  ORF Transcript_56529/g.100725 Transcript_56529/m.100725 type:complete len:228 (-) Transcript_56529:3175-3858(-)